MSHDRRPPAAGKGGPPRKPLRPKKPRPGFPLFPHASGVWAKKIRGKTCYFGPWADPEAALARYHAQRDDLEAGRTPSPAASGGVTVRELVNRFLTSKRLLLEAGELARRTWDDYDLTCGRVVRAFGVARAVSALGPADFECLRADLARTRGPVALGNEVQRVRVLFRYAFEMGLIASPVRFGPAFKRPSKKTLRKARQAKGPRMFSADEVRRMVDAAPTQLRAMILLGVNCGFGNTDCGRLPLSALDLEGGWADYPRPKTAVPRRCPLWPETVGALRAALAARPDPKAEAEALVFVTRCGRPWARDGMDNPVSKATAKLLRDLGIRRPGLNFYALRHTFETVAGSARDQPAVDHVMGHEAPGMAAVYREGVGDDRLLRVAAHVRAWLFGAEPPA